MEVQKFPLRGDGGVLIYEEIGLRESLDTLPVARWSAELRKAEAVRGTSTVREARLRAAGPGENGPLGQSGRA